MNAFPGPFRSTLSRFLYACALVPAGGCFEGKPFAALSDTTGETGETGETESLEGSGESAGSEGPSSTSGTSETVTSGSTSPESSTTGSSSTADPTSGTTLGQETDASTTAVTVLPDFIIVLGMRLNYTDCSARRMLRHRLARAVEVAQSLPNPRFIVAGGGNASPENTCPDQGFSEAQVAATILEAEFGVVASDISIEGGSTNTAENAANVAEMLEGVDYASLTLVSSDFHLHRANGDEDTSATRFFNDAFGAGTFVEGVNVISSSTMEPAEVWSDGTLSGLGGLRIDGADINGDGRQDLVGFHDDGVVVFRSSGTAFEPPESWSSTFTAANGWGEPDNLRTLADVDGDGRADAVGFGNNDVFVQLSTGDGFLGPGVWSSDFAAGDGWNASDHVRTLGDVDGDGLADVVAFGNNDVFVALSTGVAFGPQTLWSTDLSLGDGWNTTNHVRTLGDVNGDGMLDVIGFGNTSVFVALSTGSGFADSANWLPAGGVDGDSADFTAGQGYLVSQNPRGVADVDGDGLEDLWAVGNHGVYVALSTGARFEHVAGTWFYESRDRHNGEAADYQHFTAEAGWTGTLSHPRFFADVDDNGLADLVGAFEGSAYVARMVNR